MISLFKTKFYPESYENMKRVMESGWPGLGKETELFEKEVAEYLGATYVVALNSGTEALRMAIEASRLYKGTAFDDHTILTTPNTFVSTNSVIVQQGYRPAFIDIDYRTGSMDIDGAYRFFKHAHWTKPVALMIVHYGGMPVDIDKFRQLAEDFKCVLFEDCAHAFGAEYEGQKVGSTGSYNCFSFHAVKPFTTGEGGAFVTEDEELYDRVKRLRWLGIDKSTYERLEGTTYSWDYDVPSLGFKSHMSDLNATIGRGQLLHVDEDMDYREELVDRYIDNLLFLENMEIVGKQAGKRSANHLMVAKFLDYGERAKTMEALKKADIQFGHHYKNNAKFKGFRGYHKENLKNMDRWNETALTLPLNSYMKPIDVDYICGVIKGAIG